MFAAPQCCFSPDPPRHFRGFEGRIVQPPLPQRETRPCRGLECVELEFLPLAMFDALAAPLSVLSYALPGLGAKAELARIGRFYATEPMLLRDPLTGTTTPHCPRSNSPPSSMTAAKPHRARPIQTGFMP